MPDERVVELCRLWWDRAHSDLLAAERMADLPFICCFHCQQAVEKAIKSLLVLSQIDFPKSHDVGMLLELLQTSPTVPDEATAENLETLTRFAVGTRYPPEDASSEEVEEALFLARRFLNWARSKLPPEFSDSKPEDPHLPPASSE